MVFQDRAVVRRDGEFPFYSFKPNLLRKSILASTQNSMIKSIACIAIGILCSGCTRNLGPTYPADWPPLSGNSTTSVKGHECPDLSGTYVLPPNAVAVLRGARRKGEFASVHHFLSVNSQHGWLGMPNKMVLEGPVQDELKVTFHKPSGEITIKGTLRVGADFTCNGKWITEAMRNHGDGYLTTSYARDSEGRLIGFKGNADAYAGILPILTIPFPIAGFSFDRIWWRLESSPVSQ